MVPNSRCRVGSPLEYVHRGQTVRIGAEGGDLLEDLPGGGVQTAPVDQGGRGPHLAVDTVQIADLFPEQVDTERTAEAPGIHRAEEKIHTVLPGGDAAMAGREMGFGSKPWKINLLGSISDWRYLNQFLNLRKVNL
jgi:hypothetical protein